MDIIVISSATVVFTPVGYLPYSTYYKPRSPPEQGGLIIRTELIYEYTIYSVLRAEEGVGL